MQLLRFSFNLHGDAGTVGEKDGVEGLEDDALAGIAFEGRKPEFERDQGREYGGVRQAAGQRADIKGPCVQESSYGEQPGGFPYRQEIPSIFRKHIDIKGIEIVPGAIPDTLLDGLRQAVRSDGRVWVGAAEQFSVDGEGCHLRTA